MDKLEWILDVPAHIWVMVAGSASLVLGAATKIYAVEIEDEFRWFMVIFGAVLILSGIAMAVWKAHAINKALAEREERIRLAEIQRRTDDKEMRQSLLDAGQKPEDDKTVYAKVEPEVKPKKVKPKKDKTKKRKK